jgi:short-subunit dehydrogenase
MEYRAALITGASSGIGEAIARTLPRSTALWLTGRNADRLDRLAEALRAEGRRVETIAADLATAEGLGRLLDGARAAPLDLLVNNAGFGRFGGALEGPAGIDEAMIRVNAALPVTLTRALAPAMIARARDERRRAGLLYVASSLAFFPMPYMASYAASKSFLLAYAEALAAELRHEPVDVLALCPGATRTRFFERAKLSLPVYATTDDPERVAREALTALGRKTVHVVGLQGRLAALAPRLLPRRLMAGALARMAERWR